MPFDSKDSKAPFSRRDMLKYIGLAAGTGVLYQAMTTMGVRCGNHL